ncbi:hypothetical protein [Labrys sp. ZIDIC5]|uniref:hypothetical protein n=1 Tax=Labrys sedimenti TaxID=3106036 RepID=UPI002ACA55DB|nr:hypothetical protein [Labrys sp. ZIDIC5]MDZ5448951.1 hypothetical protein [Labrys sp. ZIDIC5]
MPIVQQGFLNTTALSVSDVYIQIVPPQFLINGVPSNVLGLVGSATWGPVNQPQIVGSPAQFKAKFGPYQARQYDMGTWATIAFQQGATAIQCVRVTDGTDIAATVLAQASAPKAAGKISFSGQPTASQTITLNGTAVTFVASGATGLQVNIGANLAATLASLLTLLQGSSDTQLVKFTYALSGTDLNLTAATGGTAGNSLTVATTVTGATVTNMSGGAAAAPALTLTSKYTGSFGNGIMVTIQPGSAAGTSQVLIAAPGLASEKFDNIGGSGATFWANVVAAINNGLSGSRGPSDIITATIGTSSASPQTATYYLQGGTDGVAGLNATALLGVDTVPRTGMYALRGQRVAVGALCDVTDTTSWAAQVAFGLGEGVYMITSGPAGQYPQTAATAKATAGIDSYAMKIMLGDWVYWNDTANGLPQRLVSPAAFSAGLLSALSPNQSTLNKQLQAVVGTEQSASGQPYTTADLQILAGAGIDVICNPVPGGNYFGCRNGRNASSNDVIHGDNYTRMTNYIATTLDTAMGIYVGKLQSATTRRQAKTTIDSFFGNLQQQGLIGTPNGRDDAWASVLDDSNNPASRVALGYMQADVQVQYLSVIEYFLVNLEAGQSVQIERKSVNFAV